MSNATKDARRARYTDVISEYYGTTAAQYLAGPVMAVADAEQAELRAEIKRLLEALADQNHETIVQYRRANRAEAGLKADS